MSTNERILSPFTLPNGTELKNRLLMAPMTTCTGYYDGTVTSELVEYYRAARAASAPSSLSAVLLTISAWRSRAQLVLITTRKSPGWQKSLTLSSPKAPKPCCKSTTAAAWSTQN